MAAIGTAWVRVADDLLPVRLSPRALALPHFPPLKLNAAAYPADAPVELPLRVVVELEYRDQQDSDTENEDRVAAFSRWRLRAAK